jgi:hypothetical protein
MTAATVTNTPKKKKSQGRGRSNSLPCHVVEYLKNWLMSPEHINHPYPSESEKARMVADTGIEIKRLNNWFVNNRIRFWKPRFEAMQKQQDQKKRKLSKSKENSVSSKTNSMPLPKVTPRSSPSVKQDTKKYFQVVSPVAPSLTVARLHLSHLVETVTNVSATVSDDDSDSSSYSPKASMFRRCRKRQRTEIETENLITTTTTIESSPRFKYTCNDVEEWKLACSGSFSNCQELDDTNLPSLDEAVHLFGYSIITSN